MSNKELRIARLLFISIIIAVIISIILIFLVWKNFAQNVGKQEETPTEQMTIGKFNVKEYNNDYAINKYLNILNEYFYNAEVKEIYNLMSTDYISTYQFSEEKLYSILKNKGIIGKKFILADCITAIIEGNTIYQLQLKSSDNTTYFNLNVIEESPNRFTIAFDNFLMISERNTEQSKDGLKLKIRNVTYYTDRIVTTATLTNSNNFTSFVNYQSLSESIYYRTDNSQVIDYVTEASVFNGECKIMPPNSDIELRFDVNMNFNMFSSIESLVIKDIKLTENSSGIDYEYDF